MQSFEEITYEENKSEEMYQVFTKKQIRSLNKDLDPRFVSNRKGGGNTTLRYIEGHDAIDQANRIFGYGNWSYRPLSCEQKVLMDPLTGEAVGITYKAQVELVVRGCISPVVEVGSQAVATWNVSDCIMKRRMNDAKYNKKPVDESPFNPLEIANARTTIMDAHEMAEKGAVTDALKRALRTFGDQFGNGLYGDGRIPVDEDGNASATPKAPVAQQRPQQAPQKRTVPQQQHPASANQDARISQQEAQQEVDTSDANQPPTQSEVEALAKEIYPGHSFQKVVSSLLKKRDYTGGHLTLGERVALMNKLQAKKSAAA